jgi:CubicO group peptidase (beta-lactamase class C family)
MNRLEKILAWSSGAAAGLLLLSIALWARPPELIRVGANYSAKIVCSNVFLAGRDPDEVRPGDSREHISVANLLSMTSGLDFNEGYGAVSDVTRMLYLEPDMAAFAGSKPLIHPAGAVWSYSSGAAVLLSRIFQDAVGSGAGLRPAAVPEAVAFIQKRLFAPLAMRSATMETDEHGTLVGSSYMYATPLDWARYGQFLLQDGVWNGEEILPPGYVKMMASPVPASGGESP